MNKNGNILDIVPDLGEPPEPVIIKRLLNVSIIIIIKLIDIEYTLLLARVDIKSDTDTQAITNKIWNNKVSPINCHIGIIWDLSPITTISRIPCICLNLKPTTIGDNKLPNLNAIPIIKKAKNSQINNEVL